MEKFLKYMQEVLDGMTDEEVSAMLDEFDQRCNENVDEGGFYLTEKSLEEFNRFTFDEE
jgi:hypothetical protein